MIKILFWLSKMDWAVFSYETEYCSTFFAHNTSDYTVSCSLSISMHFYITFRNWNVLAVWWHKKNYYMDCYHRMGDIQKIKMVSWRLWYKNLSLMDNTVIIHRWWWNLTCKQIMDEWILDKWITVQIIIIIIFIIPIITPMFN